MRTLATLVAGPCLWWCARVIAAGDGDAELGGRFDATVRPILAASCGPCHGADAQESGVRLDTIVPLPDAAAIGLWERIERVLARGTMPPEDAPQPEPAARRALAEWVADGLAAAKARPGPREGTTRRLTVAQLRNTLADLLGIDDDVTTGLPPDAVSRDGFTNQVAATEVSALHVEAFLAAAERALDAALVDPDAPPRIQRFRVEFGTGVNPMPTTEALVLGHISQLVPAADVLVTEPPPDKPFACAAHPLPRQFRFIEGYQGNDTVRAWREFSGIHHAVFACLRGSDGDDVRRIVDPRGRNAEMVAAGILLRPSIPGARFLGDASKYGPLPNLKIAVRELPRRGRFRVVVRAARVDDGLLVGADASATGPRAQAVTATAGAIPGTWACTLPTAGAWLVEVHLAGALPRSLAADGTPPPQATELVLDVNAGGDDRHFAAPWYQPGFVVVRLPAGPVTLRAVSAGAEPIAGMTLVPLGAGDALAARFAAFEARRPRLGVHLGLRRDCGSTLAPVGRPQTVEAIAVADHVFEGAIGNFPDPDVEADNPNYLAGIREIAVRSEYTADRDMPRLLVRSVEFEGPWFERWPPASHRAIHDVPGADAADPEDRARAILTAFAGRAFRRPVTGAEVEAAVRVWRAARAAGAGFDGALRDGLLAVLAAPQFSFLVESSAGPEAEPLDAWELASKLSYFLWNAPPDARLLALAAEGTLHARLHAEVDRLVDDPRFARCVDVFVAEWLGLARFDVVETDRERHPRLTAHAKPSLREEPARWFEHLVRGNAPIAALVASEEVVVNEVVADYYGQGDAVESGFDFVPVRMAGVGPGGLLTLPAVLAGLSDGREPNPVKRGAWFARSIVGRPPADPPPNVPKLDDLAKLPLRERLEVHRSATGCAQCHEGIDPWGLPFEAFDAAGLPRTDPFDASARLPDGTAVADFAGFRDHVRTTLLDDVVAEFLRRLVTYGCGRPPSGADLVRLRQTAVALRARGAGVRDALHAAIADESFLSK